MTNQIMLSEKVLEHKIRAAFTCGINKDSIMGSNKIIEQFMAGIKSLKKRRDQKENDILTAISILRHVNFISIDQAMAMMAAIVSKPNIVNAIKR